MGSKGEQLPNIAIAHGQLTDLIGNAEPISY
jgi:hypothetical protein